MDIARHRKRQSQGSDFSTIVREWSPTDNATRSPWGPWLWRLPIIIMVVLVLLPVSVIVVSWADPQTELWQHLKIGRASCRERVEISEVGGEVKRKEREEKRGGK